MDKRGDPNSLSVLIAERHRTVAGAIEAVVARVGTAQVDAVVHTLEDAIETAAKLSPDVAIVDLELSPNCSLVAGLSALCPDTRIIVLADRGEQEAGRLVKALASGAVGAIFKESTTEELERAFSRSSPATPVVAEEATGLLLHSYVQTFYEKRRRDVATIEALAAAVEARDRATGEHLDRVTSLAEECMDRIEPSLARNEEIAYGFTLHDVGKIGVPDAILNKRGPLDTDEWDIMRRHPEIGVRIVEPIGFSSATIDVILCHHERWDGSGYPHGLKGDEIPLAARVFAIADAYDAMTSDRPYRPAMSASDALEVLRVESGKAFDPGVVDIFITDAVDAVA
jgi:HD-GYP domain-containing protein (c-di-GMP phosphodiesterase class II)